MSPTGKSISVSVRVVRAGEAKLCARIPGQLGVAKLFCAPAAAAAAAAPPAWRIKTIVLHFLFYYLEGRNSCRFSREKSRGLPGREFAGNNRECLGMGQELLGMGWESSRMLGHGPGIAGQLLGILENAWEWARNSREWVGNHRECLGMGQG